MSEPQTMSSAGDTAPAAQASIAESCDVCGLDVPKDDMIKTELTVAGAMCPTAMTFHTACYEKAADMWQPDPESYCTVDPLFPETGQWVLPDQGRPEGWVPYKAED